MENPTRAPLLTLDAQAAIERGKELVRAHARKTWGLLFPSPAIIEKIPKPATLQVQFRDYACALLDMEAQAYIQHARDDEELSSWLKNRALFVNAEALREYGAHNEFHCSQDLVRQAVSTGLADRIERWIRMFQNRESVGADLAADKSFTILSAENHWNSPPLRQLEDKSEHHIQNFPITHPKTTLETVGEQIERLRLECDITIEDLADQVGIDPTNVSRHIRALSMPNKTSRKQYEKILSKLLNRQILLSRSQPKRS
jgi:hypothetical protein